MAMRRKSRTSSTFSQAALSPEKMTVSLTGFMGCGKSSIGKLFCRISHWDFIDLDEMIEKRRGQSVKEIFAEGGEKLFREVELETLKSVLEDRDNGTGRTVLSLGGGTLTTPEAASLIAGKTVCIYLRATTETLVDNLYKYPGERPMLGDSQSDRDSLRAKIEEMMSRRAAIYEAAADWTIDIDGKSYPAIAGEMDTVIWLSEKGKAKD